MYVLRIDIFNGYGEVEYYTHFTSESMHGAAIRAGKWLRKNYCTCDVCGFRITKRKVARDYLVWEIR